MANTVESGFVRANLNGIHFYSCYAPPSLFIDEFADSRDRLPEAAKQHFLIAIAGDFNAWIVDWSSKEKTTRGQTLLEAMSFLDVVLLNSGEEPTFEREGASSIVDRTVVSSSLTRGSGNWEVLNIFTASDHHEIIWEVSTIRKTGPAPSRPTRLDGSRRPSSSTHSVKYSTIARFEEAMPQRKCEKLCVDSLKPAMQLCPGSVVQGSTHRCTGGTTISPPFETLAFEREGRHNEAGRSPEAEELETKYEEARLTLNKAIKGSNRQCWNELLDEVEADPWGRPYGIVAVLFPQQPELDFFTEKCDVDAIPPVTLEQLLEACGRFGNAKAPGMDGIPNIVLKVAINVAPGAFLNVYNGYLEQGIFPTKWKQQ
ncbi:uncharacterized protein LOC107045002 [Diachasma alloeum]|uniref:uncharacterized protein LOC107045002 n=1 Tax=Diachasma alloeum TaxID=454923 RepID=UPI0007383DBF|nr:uncharacterized protein LOC107045002 [Diachasma alloeum]